MGSRFDPELLYAECSECGQPVILDPDQTFEILAWSGVDLWMLDPGCMILSDGCPTCHPDEDSFSTQVVRLKLDGADITGRPLR